MLPDLLDPACAEPFVKEAFADAPSRLRHILIVADRVRQSARDLNELNAASLDEPLAYCAGLVHDIGYSKAAAVSGFHPVDGYYYLANGGFRQLAELIVGHSTSPEEAALRGIALPSPPSDNLIAKLITYWDLQVLPDGVLASFEERAADIVRRYGEESLPARALELADDRLAAERGEINRLLQHVPL